MKQKICSYIEYKNSPSKCSSCIFSPSTIRHFTYIYFTVLLLALSVLIVLCITGFRCRIANTNFVAKIQLLSCAITVTLFFILKIILLNILKYRLNYLSDNIALCCFFLLLVSLILFLTIVISTADLHDFPVICFVLCYTFISFYLRFVFSNDLHYTLLSISDIAVIIGMCSVAYNFDKRKLNANDQEDSAV